MGYRRFRRPPWLCECRTAIVGRFLTILKISGFCQKFEFWVFWGVIGHSGSLEMSVFLVFGRSQNFDFLGFFGRPPTQPSFNFWLKMRFLTILKILDFWQNLVFGYFGWSLETRGSWKCRFFWFLVDFKILFFFGFLGGLKILAGGYGAVLVGVSVM